MGVILILVFYLDLSPLGWLLFHRGQTVSGLADVVGSGVTLLVQTHKVNKVWVPDSLGLTVLLLHPNLPHLEVVCFDLHVLAPAETSLVDLYLVLGHLLFNLVDSVNHCFRVQVHSCRLLRAFAFISRA